MARIPDRVDWIDAARGIGIVLVVIGHVEGGLIDAGIQSGASWAWPSYGLYTFHMPLFFFLAGLNVPGSLAKGAGRFLRAKAWTIAYPYFLWSLIQGGLLVALSSLTNGHARPSDLLGIAWHPLGQFWFLYALMLCQLAAIVLTNHPRTIIACAILSLAAASLLPRGGIAEETLHAFPFFAAGILLAHRARRGGGERRSRGLSAALAAIGLVVTAVLSGPLDGMDHDALLALPASACGIATVVLVAQSLAGQAARCAVRLGLMSMTVYVLHVMAAAGARIALLRLHVQPDPWLYVVAGTVAGIALPCLAHAVLERLGLLMPLGLGPYRSARRVEPVAA